MIANNKTLNEYQKVFLAFSVGLLVPYSFAPHNVTYLLPIILGILFVSVFNSIPLHGFLKGWLFGVAQFGTGFYWLYYLSEYSALNGIAAYFALFFVFSLQAMFTALSIFSAMFLSKKNSIHFLIGWLPITWIVFELLRCELLIGMPWLLVGYSQIDTPLSGFAPIIGAQGIGYLIVLCAGILAYVMPLSTVKRV